MLGMLKHRSLGTAVGGGGNARVSQRSINIAFLTIAVTSLGLASCANIRKANEMSIALESQVTPAQLEACASRAKTYDLFTLYGTQRYALAGQLQPLRGLVCIDRLERLGGKGAVNFVAPMKKISGPETTLSKHNFVHLRCEFSKEGDTIQLRSWGVGALVKRGGCLMLPWSGKL